MAETSRDNLLARLALGGVPVDGVDPWSAIAATQPQPEAPGAVVVAEKPAGDAGDDKLDAILGRIKSLSAQSKTPAAAVAVAPVAPPLVTDDFLPFEPATFREAQLNEAEVEALILKYLLSCGSATGRDIADQVKLAFKPVEELLRQMKNEQLVVYRGAAQMNDYQYQVTDMGRERARRLIEHCSYFGSAPVSLKDYIASVAAQSLTKQNPSVEDLQRAFSDILLNKRMLMRLGPAINSGRGLFLYGSAGNGKTSIAERVTKAFGQTIWVPRAIGVDGEIIRIYDPINHDEAPLGKPPGLLEHQKIDQRWVRIRRPTIVVGGELTMSHLEVTINTSTGISEAPLQLKSNCGTLVIDDFGRQKMRIDELLNRWIVPLEKRYDFLNLPNGKKIQVPFDQLIIFSTNLQPRDLVDEAFLRRIPYKIDVTDPSEEEFRELFRIMSSKLGFEYRDETIDHLIQRHYQPLKRPFRCCQPRDLLMQIRNFCLYQNRAVEMSDENFDYAVENYFAVM
jgi:DNA-binding PadR family transcriptional regulator